MRRMRIVAAALTVAGAMTGAWALDRAFPPDLGRFHERSTLIVDEAGAPLRAFTTSTGQWRFAADLDAVSSNYLDMLIAYEDRRFWRHPGVDPLALARALGQWATHGRVTSGASTLTMQVARLLEPRERGIGAKLIEMARALQLEWRHDKRQILAMYLTLAPYGGNLQGVRAATLAWFGHGPERLTTAEAALLVALPQSPERRRPDLDPAAARASVERVLRRLEGAGVLTSQTMAEALEERLPDRRRAMPFRAPHLAGLLARRAPGGATVTTAIDGPLQDRLETLARDEARWFGDGASLAIVVVENRGRAVRAWVGGHDFFGTAGQIDLTRARRSPGSTLKPFAYGIGFDELAAHPRTLIDDAPLIFPGYAPRNFDRLFHGVVTIEEALRQSLNVPAVALVDRIGAERFTAALRHAGAHLAFGRRGQRAGLPVVLGGVGISLADLVMLYAAVADDGRSLPLRLTNDTPERSPVTLMSAQSARDLARILAGAPRPSAMAAASAQDGTRRVAFKTGTSYGFRDAWAIGFGRSHTIGVWVGRADGTPRPGAYGRIAAAPILFKVLDRLPGFVELAESELVEAEQAPVGLKRFRPAAATLSARRHTDEAGPRIVFPPDGAEIELDRDDDALPAELMLSAEGGRRPLRWVVNGLPLVDDGTAPAVAWRPAGEGFARIVVIDAADRAAVATVRLR